MYQRLPGPVPSAFLPSFSYVWQNSFLIIFNCKIQINHWRFLYHFQCFCVCLLECQRPSEQQGLKDPVGQRWPFGYHWLWYGEKEPPVLVQLSFHFFILEICRLWEKLLRRNQTNSKQSEESLEHKLTQAFLSLDISQGSYRSWSSVPFSPPVQMRCREMKLWDRRALNSSIGSISHSTSSGWVLHPQPSEMMALTTMCVDVWRWEDGRSFMCVVCVEVSCPRGQPGRGVTPSLHIPGSETTVGSLPGKKKVCASLHDTSIISAKGQAAGNTSARLSPVSLLAGLCSWPFLLSLFSQTRLLKGQCRAEAGLSQERGGMEGWKLNKDGRSEFSFRSLCIFNTANDSNPTLSTDGWFSMMWWTQLFFFHYFQQHASPRSALLRFSYSCVKMYLKTSHSQVFNSQGAWCFIAWTQKRDHKQCWHH